MGSWGCFGCAGKTRMGTTTGRPRYLPCRNKLDSATGGGAKLASSLRGWAHLRYEITEEASEGSDGSRWSHTPELGIFHATTDVTGNIMVSEDRIRYAYEQANGDPSAVYHELSLALGESWDEELEPFRQAADGANVRWLHRVG